MQPFGKPHFMYLCFGLLVLYSKIFVIVATVPTRLQTCAKVLQMHISGGGGKPCFKPKSNVTFKLASFQLFQILAADLGFKDFHYSCHSAHKIANLCKSAANAHFRRWGDTLVGTQ